MKDPDSLVLGFLRTRKTDTDAATSGRMLVLDSSSDGQRGRAEGGGTCIVPNVMTGI